MKQQAIVLTAVGLAAFAATAASAEEVGRVISSTPVVQQVPVPRQVCSQAYVQPQPSGGGAVVGAIVGGLLGNTIGAGMGRAAATGVGVVAGAAVGNNVEAGTQAARAVPQCFTQTTYENRTVAWNVQYEWNGQQYSAQLPYDPGKTIRLQLSPAMADAAGPQGMPPSDMPPSDMAPSDMPPSGPPPGAQAQAPGQPQAVILGEVPTTTAVAPAYAYPGYPAYPPPPAYYYPQPYIYPPVGLSLGIGFVGGGHRHWR